MPNNSRGITDINYGLPSHLSEETFRRFEPFIRQAVSNAPNDTSFTIPEAIAPTTFVARLRDSTLSLKKFGWTTDIDVDKLWTLTGKMVWSYDHTTKLVWYREKQPRGRPSELTSEARSHGAALSKASSIRWSDWTTPELDALVLLLHSGKLIGPFILAGPVPEADQTRLSASADISFVFDQTNNETIVT